MMGKNNKDDKNALKKKVGSLIHNEVNFLLNLCKKMEILMVELYSHFANVFKDNDEIYKLWRKMQFEEENHVKHFDLAMKISSEAIENLTFNKNEIMEKYLEMAEMLEKIKKDSSCSLEDAIKMAIQLEENLEDVHVSTISKFKNNSFKQLFISMKSCDEAHIDMLKDMLCEIKK